MARRPGRPRAGEEALSRRRIVEEGLRLVDADGVGALTMRRLAGTLGVDPMALYRHVASRQALIAALIEAVFGELEPPPAEWPWRERVVAAARRYIALAAAHPNLVAHIISEPQAVAPAALVTSEALYAALSEAGLAPAQVVRAADLIADYLNGYALALASGHLGGAGERSELRALLGSLPAERFPAMRGALAAVSDAEVAADVEAGLAIILAGVAAMAGER